MSHEERYEEIDSLEIQEHTEFHYIDEIVDRTNLNQPVIEIYFTCFRKQDKACLNKWAEELGCKVRSGVTKKLSLLVCGPSFGGGKGARKYENAMAQGTDLVFRKSIKSKAELRQILSDHRGINNQMHSGSKSTTLAGQHLALA